jgi:two-component system, response regulator PdtaR
MNRHLTPSQLVILVVEDEPLLRLLAAELLGDAGFEVLEAGSSEEALRILDSRLDVNVVFTDVEMPGALDGLALARRIRELHPQIGLLVTSGRGLRPADALPDQGSFLAKPYTAGRLLGHIEAVVENGCAAAAG